MAAKFDTFNKMGDADFDPITTNAVFPTNLLKAGLKVRLSYIGMGASATIHLIESLNDYTSHFKADPDQAMPLHVDIFDRSGKWTIGGEHVYDPSNITFTLNQPAILMGIEYQNQLVHWLSGWHQRKDPEKLQKAQKIYADFKKQGMSDERISYLDPENYLMAKEFGPYDYIPRALYGTFLKEVLEAKIAEVKAIVNAACGLNAKDDDANHNIFSFCMRQESVETISLKKDGSLIVNVADGDKKCHADVLVGATGHLQGGVLAKFENTPGYGNTPFTICEIEDAVKAHPEGPVIIVGTGQAMLDALAALEGIGYEGKIIAVSGDLVEPWPHDASIEHGEKSAFRFTDFGISSVSRVLDDFKDDFDNPELMNQLRGLIQNEMHCEQAIRCCPSEVLKKFAEMKDAYQEIMQDCPKIFEACEALFAKHQGNPTSPTRFTLYQKMRASGQLELVQGRAMDNLSQATEEGFTVTIRHGNENLEIKGGVVLNCASMTKSPWDRNQRIANPALRSLEDIGVIEKDIKNHTLKPCEDDGRVVLIGPASGGPWGIPYTRAQIKSAAKKTFGAMCGVCRGLYDQFCAQPNHVRDYNPNNH